MAIRLVIAGDHPLVLSGMERLLGAEPNCEVLACCADGREALEAVRRHRPNILILDSRLPILSSVEVIQSLLHTRSLTRVVLYAESSEEELLREAVRLGVHGLALKEMPPAMLLKCVHRVAAGEYWLEWRAASRVLAEMRLEEGGRRIAGILTRREQEIVGLICRGLRNKEVAKVLSISESTVKVHLRHTFKKLNVKGRLALLRFAEDQGLIRTIRP